MNDEHAPARTASREPSRRPSRPGWDALLLALLVMAHLQVLGLAEAAALPLRLQDVLRHPVLGRLIPPAGVTAFGEVGPRPGEPVGLVLFALTLGGVLLYFVADLALRGRRKQQVKWVLLVLIIITALVLPTGKLILLRQGSGPASYTHDGGVIQTEATIRFLLAGRNPYVEDYTETPMAEWGFNEYRTALYHYPYLPWTFLFSAPFYVAGTALGFYDQRLIYLGLLLVGLVLAPRLAAGRRGRLALVMVLALNPIMALDVIFGQNDVFVLAWLLFSLVSLMYGHDLARRGTPARWPQLLSLVFFGLACASKPTAWFFAPFYGLLLLADDPAGAGRTWADLARAVPRAIGRAWPALLTVAVIVLPYVLWDAGAFYDDVWRWSSGKGETGYQIWGWGASNFVLALGLVTDRFDQWPFWVTQVLVALPLLVWFLRRQQLDNTLANASWHYAVLLLGFFYASRFLNENYLGFILAFLAIGIFAQRWDEPAT